MIKVYTHEGEMQLAVKGKGNEIMAELSAINFAVLKEMEMGKEEIVDAMEHMADVIKKHIDDYEEAFVSEAE